MPFPDGLYSLVVFEPPTHFTLDTHNDYELNTESWATTGVMTYDAASANAVNRRYSNFQAERNTDACERHSSLDRPEAAVWA